MRKNINRLLIACFILFSGCKEEQSDNVIKFATSADYPPFEYQQDNELKGFDIDLANLIASEMGKKAVFENMQFSTILPSLNSGTSDAAISTITITDERKKNFDFSTPYHFETMAAVYRIESPITEQSQLSGKKVACQLGTTMAIWLQKNFPDMEVMMTNNNNQAIASLKAGHVDAVVVDGVQGNAYSIKEPGLAYLIIGKSEDGYGIAFKKGSLLKKQSYQH